MKRKHATLTRHGRERMRGRLRLSGAAPERMADRALREGLPVEAFAGRVRRWLEGKIRWHGKGANTHLYGEIVYVFERDILITCFALPADLRGPARAAAKRWKERAAS